MDQPQRIFSQRKLKSLAALSVCVLVGSLLSDLLTQLNNEWSRVEIRRILSETLEDNDQQHQEQPEGATPPQQQRRLFARFRYKVEDLPESHVSEPYLVGVDADTGAVVASFAFDHADHPMSNLIDVRERRREEEEEKEAKDESIFFFESPKAYGDKVKSMLTECYGIRRAEKKEDPESLAYIEEGVLNVDAQTRQGLAKARETDLVSQDLVDMISTSYFYEGMMAFKPEHRGRAFTILEHPVVRAQNAYRSRGYNLKDFSLVDYVSSPNYADNLMVRLLTNDKTGVITEDHFLVAKGVLARKFVVGVADYMDETMRRLEMYYRWPAQDECVSTYLNENGGIQSPQEKGTLAPSNELGSEYLTISTVEMYDLELYRYALELLVKQGVTMFGRPFVDKDGNYFDFEALAKERQDELLRMMGLLPPKEVEDEEVPKDGAADNAVVGDVTADDVPAPIDGAPGDVTAGQDVTEEAPKSYLGNILGKPLPIPQEYVVVQDAPNDVVPGADTVQPAQDGTNAQAAVETALKNPIFEGTAAVYGALVRTEALVQPSVQEDTVAATDDMLPMA